MSIMGESNVLFHEMWHAYQAFGEAYNTTDGGTWQSSALNGEIEARYAAYLYLRDLPEYSQHPWSEYTDQDPVWIAIENLTRFLDEKGNLLPGVTEAQFKEQLLNGPIYQLRNAPNYRNVYGSYPLDATRNSSQNFKNQKTLSGGC